MKYLDVEQHGRIHVLKVLEDLKGGAETEALHERLRGLAEDRAEAVVIDLAAVGFINSLALGVLVSGYVTCTRLGVRLVLSTADDRVAKLLSVTHLDSVLELFDTLGGALSACGADLAGERATRDP